MDTLNITSLLAGLSPQMMTSMTAGQQNGAQTPVDGSFMELLQGLVAQLSNPAEPMAGTAAPAQAPPWLDTLLSLLGQNGNLPAQTPDPDGEASLTATTAQLTSMTDVMAAIQSILPETSLGQLADADALMTQPQIHPGSQDDGADQQTPLEATLAAIMGFMPTELAVDQQSAAPADAAPAQQSAQTTLAPQGTVIPVQTNGAALQPATVAQSAEGQAVDVQQTIQPQPAASAAEGATQNIAAATQAATKAAPPAETTASTDFSTALNTAQAQANQPASNGETTAPATTAARPAEGQAALNLRPEGQTSGNGNAPATTAAASTVQAQTVQATTQSDTQSQRHDNAASANDNAAMPTASVVQTEPSARPVFAINDAQPAEAKSVLPNIPALHQLTDSIKLLNENGQTSVRLTLHPESLGQVLVQLHVNDGQVAVHLLAETSQAQTLIQNHLPQLKAAFSMQGLTADALNVNVGSDASAFNAPGQHQQQAWASQANRPYFTPANGNTAAPSTPITGPASRSSGSLSQIDYQV